MSSSNNVRMFVYGIPPLLLDKVRDLLGSNIVVTESGSDDGTENLERMDCFFVRGDFFFAHLDFFLPRRQCVALFSLDSIHHDFCGGGIMTIGLYDSSTDVLEKLMAIIPEKGSVSSMNELSAREKEVLIEVASGKTNKEIAEKLFISVNTVITHRKNISAKLGIRSVSGLSVYALMNGLI